MKKRMFAMLLALVMIVSMLPLAAFAATEADKCISKDGNHKWDNNTGKCTNSRWVAGSRQYCNAQCTHAAGFTLSNNRNRCNICKLECDHKNNNKTQFEREATFRT